MTGLDYFEPRCCDADVGLWISPDPAREFHDLYSYVGGNPINLIDPNGLASEAYLKGHPDNPYERYMRSTTPEQRMAAANRDSKLGLIGIGLLTSGIGWATSSTFLSIKAVLSGLGFAGNVVDFLNFANPALKAPTPLEFMLTKDGETAFNMVNDVVTLTTSGDPTGLLLTLANQQFEEKPKPSLNFTIPDFIEKDVQDITKR